MRWLAGLMLAVALQGVPGEVAEPRGSLGPLEFLVGSCWIGTFPDGVKTDEHCFEWMFDRKFIRDRHVVRGGEPYQGESILGWDGNTKRLAFWYWNSDGVITVGRILYTKNGIVFPERYSAPSGEVELEALWTRVGQDGYRVLQRQRTGTGWKTLWTMELRRKGDAPG